jgi:hypothetical protein
MASDDELMAWGRELTVRRPRRKRPLVATRINVATPDAAAVVESTTISTEELFAEIAERAASGRPRRRVVIRR